ncbi:uncharacterized protein EHS24_005948 [Apiotrichum porosum]|uniref:Velvet domain-containing protein n=1 Tax=Apiotrichum porosum TaxID=105984 RepID=A0A427Y012_9TREE|nr:uncharacterized protein EHS24_005948 [Apiotrichum porosum]RSH84427.1 hypothetical protein EHS24_005948 [Apiotrichum porosum]
MSRSAPPNGRHGRGDEAVDELTDESNDDSGEDSDELDDGDDERGPEIRRELSGSLVGDQVEVSTKDLVYILEVIQQPQRARACGFGDKDRRPLSPPPIIQLRILDKLGKSVSPNTVDYHRFILMVDLWNGDQTQQRSIVMHPGARQDQYALFTHTASRPSTFAHHPYDVAQSTFNRVPLRSQTAPFTSWQGGGGGSEWTGYGGASAARAPYGLPHDEWYDEQRPSSSSSRHGPPLVEPPQPYGPRQVSADRWPPTPESAPQTFPDYGSMERPGSGHASYRSGSGDGGWYREPSYPRDVRPHTAGYEYDRQYGGGRPWSSGDGSRSRSQVPLFTHVPAASPIGSQSGLPLVSSPGSSTANSHYPDTYADRLTATSHYSRVLVGSMGAVCQRLKGLDGEPGLFFFAHDLGIRTEGTFSLRFTLADISSLSVPTVLKDQSSQVLARIFSNSFTVYSAKRFPGVLPTTDLTQCFADQSVRLPTRQKRANNSSSGSKRKK